MSAAAMAILGALSFAVGTITTRRAVIKMTDATAGVLITLLISVPFFLLILIATGRIGAVTSFSWQSYLWLAAAGILHFIGGRSLFFHCTKLVGANIASVLVGVNSLASLILGVSVLGEPLTLELTVGVLLIVFGIMLTAANPQMFRRGQGLFSDIPRKAVLFGLGAGLAWGTSPILIKVGLDGSGSPVAGALISYLAATLVLSIPLFNHDRRTALTGMGSRAVVLFVLVGLLSSTAHLLRYVALSMAPASVINPLFSVAPIFHVFLAFVINRKLEVFTRAVIIGTIAVFIGAILLV